eukprot:1861200-Amphidinium_carterae.1
MAGLQTALNLQKQSAQASVQGDLLASVVNHSSGTCGLTSSGQWQYHEAAEDQSKPSRNQVIKSPEST